MKVALKLLFFKFDPYKKYILHCKSVHTQEYVYVCVWETIEVL